MFKTIFENLFVFFKQIIKKFHLKLINIFLNKVLKFKSL